MGSWRLGKLHLSGEMNEHGVYIGTTRKMSRNNEDG